MQNTVILGATGFLGPHLVASAFARSQAEATMAEPLGPPVIAVGRNIQGAPRYTHPRDGADWESLDLLEPGALEAAFERWQPTHVVLAAAMSKAKDCEADPAAATRCNAELPGRVAELCKARKARLVFVSTDQVFGGEPAPKLGFSESALPTPISEYGRSKALGETRVLAAYPGALVVRLPLLYGDSAGRGLGASDSLLEAVDRDERPKLFTDEFRTPLEVRNAAEALIAALWGPWSGVMHVAGPSRTSRMELGLAILEAMGLSREEAKTHVVGALRAEVDCGAPRPQDVSLDARKASKALGVRLLDVSEGLDHAMGA